MSKLFLSECACFFLFKFFKIVFEAIERQRKIDKLFSRIFYSLKFNTDLNKNLVTQTNFLIFWLTFPKIIKFNNPIFVIELEKIIITKMI